MLRGFVGGVVIQKSHTAYSSAFQSTCGLAAALYWLEQELDILAVIHMGARSTLTISIST